MEDAGSIPAGLPLPYRELPRWRRIRAGMPAAEVVGAAAAARAAGDWRGAAGLLPVDVDVDLAAVRDRFGAEAAGALEDDLHHLALDLLWWHLPRTRGGLGTLQARVSAILAPPAGAATAPLLRLRLPSSPTGPQRVRLDVTDLTALEYERWFFTPRYTWDVRETEGLRPIWQSRQVYPLLSAGEHERAWRECGITLTFTEPDALRRTADTPTSPVGVAALARAAAAAFDTGQVATIFGAYLTLNLPELTADASDPSEWLEVPVRIPTGTIPADLALIEAGLMTPADLHPLMRSALFPEAGGAPALAPEPAPAPGAYRTRCGREWHRLSIAGGALRLDDHDEVEQLREAALRSLGGTSTGCYAVQEAWRTGAGRLPRALREHRQAVIRRLHSGDTAYLLSGLAAGTLDPQMRAGNGWSLLHMAMWLDHERALPALLAAGLPVDARDRIERTPLYVAVMNGGDPQLIRRLLDEGADPEAETVHGADPASVARNRAYRDDLPFLAAR